MMPGISKASNAVMPWKIAIARSPGTISRTVIRPSAAAGRAPAIAAASSSDGSIERSNGTSIRKALGTILMASSRIMPPSE
jgi:hypothetical protein